jgi:hypothetical protein
MPKNGAAHESDHAPPETTDAVEQRRSGMEPWTRRFDGSRSTSHKASGTGVSPEGIGLFVKKRHETAFVGKSQHASSLPSENRTHHESR